MTHQKQAAAKVKRHPVKGHRGVTLWTWTDPGWKAPTTPRCDLQGLDCREHSRSFTRLGDAEALLEEERNEGSTRRVGRSEAWEREARLLPRALGGAGEEDQRTVREDAGRLRRALASVHRHEAKGSFAEYHRLAPMSRSSFRLRPSEAPGAPTMRSRSSAGCCLRLWTPRPSQGPRALSRDTRID